MRLGMLLDEPTCASYLRRLNVVDAPHPSVVGLRRLHTAHVERVPYETVGIVLGRRTTIDPIESARRIATTPYGGYCFHLNGAFAALLSTLGYSVRLHRGGVQRHLQPKPVGATANHMALTVSDLPAENAPDGRWLVDVGLGDALHEPIPLRSGTHRQGPRAMRLTRSSVIDDGWRLDHDPAGGFIGMDFELRAAKPADFAAQHEHLSASADSGFVRVVTVQRRVAEAIDVLRGCLLTRYTVDGESTHEIGAETDWQAVLAESFGLRLDDLDQTQRHALWTYVRTAHEQWRQAIDENDCRDHA